MSAAAGPCIRNRRLRSRPLIRIAGPGHLTEKGVIRGIGKTAVTEIPTSRVRDRRPSDSNMETGRGISPIRTDRLPVITETDSGITETGTADLMEEVRLPGRLS